MKRRDLFTSFLGLIGTAAAVPFLDLGKQSPASPLELVFKKNIHAAPGNKANEISALRRQYLRDGRIASITKETLQENGEDSLVLKIVLKFKNEENMQQYLKEHRDIFTSNKTVLG